GVVAVQEHTSPVVKKSGACDGNERLPNHFHDAHPPPCVELLPRHQVILCCKTSRLAFLPAERSHDSHPGERLGGARVDLLALLANDAKLRTNCVDPSSMSKKDGRQQHDRANEKRPIDPCQDCKTAKQLNDSSPRIENHAKHELANAAAIFTQD